MEVRVKFDIRPAVKFMDDLQRRQLPFVTAKALTITAKDVQAAEIQNVKRRFTVRSNWFQPKNPMGVRIKPATKTNLRAEISIGADFMQLHETGGTKTPRGKMIAVPSANVRRNKKDRIPNNLRPKALLKREGRRTVKANKKKGVYKHVTLRTYKKAFIGTLRDDRLGLWLRTHRGLKLMYQLVPAAEIDRRLEFVETGRRIASERFSINFGRAMNEALKSAR